MTAESLKKTLFLLDFEQIRSELSACCHLDSGREAIGRLCPSFSYNEVQKLLARTKAARALADEKGAPAFTAAPAIPESLVRVRKGALLSMGELLQIAAMLANAESVRFYGSALEENNALYGYFQMLTVHTELEERIRFCILSEDQISDRASPALEQLRKKIRHTSSRVRDTLQQFLTGSRAAHLQEPIVTMRSGRFVLPVKVEHKNSVPGLVHDTSASGATVFIEPMSVVELNNEIKLLENEEQKEIERILYELCAKCAGIADLLERDYQALTELSVQFAKAEYAYRIEAREVVCNADGKTDLKRARHPLLAREKVVPIDLSVGKDYDTLVITGPNTGGKTVTLKTLGVLALMNQCGLQLPVEEGSEIGFFSQILADIGDEQSIEQSLSTFSAHMVNIVSILDSIEPGTLVLFDELGAGTDPLEGAALAVSILEKTRALGAICLATTHYAELKTYALETDGVENASCEFDLKTLRPTYRLITGVPGRSNAFRIARRLGLSDDVIDQANALMSRDSRKFEEVIEKLEAERIRLEESLKEADAARAIAETAKVSAEKKSKEILAAAEKDAKRMTAESRRLVETSRRASSQAFEELERLRKKTEKERKEALLEEARANLKGIFQSADEQIEQIKEEVPTEPLPRPLVIGDLVQIAGTQKRGVVEKIKNGEIQIKTDGSRIKLPVERILLVDPNSVREEKPVRRQSGVSSGRATIRNEVDVRGMIGDDAWFVVDRYLDEAHLAGLESVRVIHGKGTGALRQALWRLLKKDPRVSSIRLGAFGEGDSGVTVVSLK